MSQDETTADDGEYREPDSKGRITIPQKYRDNVSEPGFQVTQDDDGTIQLTPARVTTR